MASEGQDKQDGQDGQNGKKPMNWLPNFHYWLPSNKHKKQSQAEPSQGHPPAFRLKLRMAIPAGVCVGGFVDSARDGVGDSVCQSGAGGWSAGLLCEVKAHRFAR